MRTEHRVVFQAVSVASAIARKPVSADTVYRILEDEEVDRLDSAYARTASASVLRILRHLARAGALRQVVDEDRVRRFEPSKSDAAEEEATSMRRIVLAEVEQCVADYGRPIRISELSDWIETQPAIHLDPADVRRSVASLVHTGELVIFDTILGAGSEGKNLYCLSSQHFTEDVFDDIEPTWLGTVWSAFEQLWNNRLEVARQEQRKPRPPTTADIRAAVREIGLFSERLDNTQLLCNAVRSLAVRENPLLRPVQRPYQRELVWVPLNWPDEELDLGSAHASDAARVSEALARAERIAARPVTANEVEIETKGSPELAPAGASTVATILADLSQTTVYVKEGERVPRNEQHVHRVGLAGGSAYYSTDDSAHGQTYVKLKELEVEWAESAAPKRREQIARCSLQAVRRGRAVLLFAELTDLLGRISGLPVQPDRRDVTVQLWEDLKKRVEEEVDLTATELPVGDQGSHVRPRRFDEGFTTHDLMTLLDGLYPAIKNIEEPHRLGPLLARHIRRLPNPDHTRRFDSNPVKAAEYLFERTETLQKAAFRWGSPEARLQATLSAETLGRLRDPAFVLPGLEATVSGAKLTTVACLAFLQSPETEYRLLEVAAGDGDPQVRAAATWAAQLVAARANLAAMREVLLA